MKPNPKRNIKKQKKINTKTGLFLKNIVENYLSEKKKKEKTSFLHESTINISQTYLVCLCLLSTKTGTTADKRDGILKNMRDKA